jgi:hypothetical protein
MPQLLLVQGAHMVWLGKRALGHDLAGDSERRISLISSGPR